MYSTTHTEKIDKKKAFKREKSPQKILSIVSQDIDEEICSTSDSIVFEAKNLTNPLRTSSGEFSVHSNLSETNSWSPEYSQNLAEGGRLLSKLDGDTCSSDDCSDSASKSSIPFSNYTNSSKKNLNSDIDLSGDSVVFEASNLSDSVKLSPKDGTSIQSSDHSIIFNLDDCEGESKTDAVIETEKSRVSNVSVPENIFFVYIQTQLYQKETLKDWLKSNTLNRNREVIFEIFCQITDAVDYVHSHHLMHRDLKVSCSVSQLYFETSHFS